MAPLGIPNSVALVTGATGAVGPSLVSYLIQRGYEVRTFSRSPSLSGTSHPLVSHFLGSINNAAALAPALKGVDIVFHLAAKLHIENPAPELGFEYQLVNVEGTKQVASQAAKAGASRIVYFSTVKVYGIRQRQPVEETCTPSPKTMYAQTKLEGELAVQSTPGIDSTVLRLSPVYGPRLKGSWERLVRAIARGRFLPIGNLNNVHSLTHVDDVARAALLVAEHPNAIGQTFNLVGHENPTMRDILGAIYSAYGKQLPSVHFPSNLALFGTLVMERSLSIIGKRTPLPVEALRQLIEDEAYSAARLRALGFNPQVSLTDGWLMED